MIAPDTLAALRSAAAHCRAAYDMALLPPGSKPFFHSWGEMAGFTYLEPGGSFIWRAWMGTHTPFDWLQDARANPDATGVHTGVAAHYADALPSMIAALGAFPRGAPILDTGHSLGGALAELAWADTVGGLAPITFCAMRCFTSTRARSLANAGIRVVNERDLVPHLPGRLGLWSYAHRSQALRFCGASFEPRTAHSLELSVGPALDGRFALTGPLDLD